MCRFTLYLGPALPLASLVTEPENSLIHQSYNASERAEPLNGDGFGLAWYPADGSLEPGLFRALTPAWSNASLTSLARVVKSGCILAHVRAATQVRFVSEANCHPFVHGRFAFMHNGDLGGFQKVRRPLLARLSDEAFESVHGQTDTEHVFGLFLDRVRVSPPAGSVELGAALKAALADALELSRAHGGGDESYLNVAVSDGKSAAVSRYTTEDDYDGESLYWSGGKRYTCEEGVCRMIAPDAEGMAVVVSSERLSPDESWQVIPRNHMLLVDRGRPPVLEPLDL